MVISSKTGLHYTSNTKKTLPRKIEEKKPIEFKNIASPAPFTLRPFAGLYNPFPYGCSILCNHPADSEAKEILRKAREEWVSEVRGKGRISSEHYKCRKQDDRDDNVPEELFRKYTDTDSRPLTPTPTLVSVMTRVTGGRRCVTPDCVPLPKQERTLLILDLRRSHSQETLSYHIQNELPTTVLHPPTPSPTPSSGRNVSRSSHKSRKVAQDSLLESDHDTKVDNKMLNLPPQISENDVEETQSKRRGRLHKKGKKSARDSSAGIEKEFRGIPDPGETQVSALGNDSCIGSTRPSLTVLCADGTSVSGEGIQTTEQHGPAPSFLDFDILKQLHRQLDQEVIDNEFHEKRKIALEEALRMFPPSTRQVCNDEMMKVQNEEMIQLQNGLQLPPTNTELWLSLPRIFSRQSARFELPLDKRVLNTMTPLEYVSKHIAITSGCKLLYSTVFNRHKRDVDEEEDTDSLDRRIYGEKIITALGEVMGRPFTDDEAIYFHKLVGWKDNEWIDFRTWAGICALCERLLGPKFCSQLPSRDTDPCNEIEKVDFDTLPERLKNLNPDPRLTEILNAIRDL